MKEPEPVVERLRRVLVQTLEVCRAAGLYEGDLPAVALERPKRPEHGDFATNVALLLGKRAQGGPRKLAEALCEKLHDPDHIVAKVEVAGPGFLNIRIADGVWRDVLGEVLARGLDYGRGRADPNAPSVLIEYVSANPTGPLHVGHGRGAAIGDALARLLTFAGLTVSREFYVNDAGNQVLMLAWSTWARYMELRGKPAAFPENGYKGEYIRDLAAQLNQQSGGQWESIAPTPEALAPIRDFAIERMKAWQERTLATFRCSFDRWFSERSLFGQNAVEACLAELRAAGHLYEQDGAVWFKSIELGGDERDRVVIKSTGEKTYLAGDLAYHRDKLARGFGRLINVLGADHIGHTPGLKAALRAFGKDPSAIEVLLYQFVRLVRDGQEVKMGKRSGEFVTLDDLLEEVGVDATRFFFLARRHDTHVEFDLELAKSQSLDNPVYYAQYGHARAAAVLRRAAELGVEVPARLDAKLSAKLALPEEIAVCRLLAEFPIQVRDAALAREPHRIILYLTSLAQEFQSYYTRLQKVHGDTILPQARHRAEPGWQERWDWDKTKARLLWVRAIQQGMASALTLLGISAPSEMARAPGAESGAPNQDDADE
jgi:arginyl-tRNA synthetase